ncbi:RNA polymerase sigma-70 factor [Puteibacter caeruleilacunae]|nr:RNA polymerase sigma-70 factor [Puteibacter caeruleilacunae]
MQDFDKIFNTYYHGLLVYGLKFIDHEQDVEDIIQEVFKALWESKKYNLQEQHLKSYLFNAVRNGCLNFIKHENIKFKHREQNIRLLKDLELSFYASGEKSLIEKEDLDKIYASINSLSTDYQQVIIMSRFDGLMNKQIAEKLDIPVRTVETRLYRALSKLRQILTEKQVLILLNLIDKKGNLPF